MAVHKAIQQYTPTKRARIYTLKKQHVSNEKITALFGPHKATINRIVKEYDERGTHYPLKGRAGRPHKLTDRDGHRAARAIKSGKADTAVDVQQQLFPHVSAQTVRRSLKANGLRAYAKRKVPFLLHRHQRARLEWARGRRFWTPRQWQRVIFSDESKFNVFGSDGRKYCWREKGHALDPRCTEKRIKHGGGSVMVWACLTPKGPGRLHRIDGIMNAVKYTAILAESLLGTLRDHKLKRSSILFQQDNDPKHTSKLAKQWFVDNKLSVLPWPANSPDMNIIENAWDALDRRVRKRDPLPRNENELWEALQEEWEVLGKEYTDKLYRSLPRRLQKLYSARGGNTPY